MKQLYRFLIPLVLAAVEFVTLTCSPLSASAQDTDIRNRVKANEGSCIATLRTINVAQAAYQGGDETRGFARTLKELGPAGASFIDGVTASGRKDGYRFRMIPDSKQGSRPITHYTITAQPITRLIENQRSFFTDETHVIRFTTENRDATAADQAIGAASPE